MEDTVINHHFIFLCTALACPEKRWLSWLIHKVLIVDNFNLGILLYEYIVGTLLLLLLSLLLLVSEGCLVLEESELHFGFRVISFNPLLSHLEPARFQRPALQAWSDKKAATSQNGCSDFCEAFEPVTVTKFGLIVALLVVGLAFHYDYSYRCNSCVSMTLCTQLAPEIPFWYPAAIATIIVPLK